MPVTASSGTPCTHRPLAPCSKDHKTRGPADRYRSQGSSDHPGGQGAGGGPQLRQAGKGATGRGNPCTSLHAVCKELQIACAEAGDAAGCMRQHARGAWGCCRCCRRHDAHRPPAGAAHVMRMRAAAGAQQAVQKHPTCAARSSPRPVTAGLKKKEDAAWTIPLELLNSAPTRRGSRTATATQITTDHHRSPQSDRAACVVRRNTV